MPWCNSTISLLAENTYDIFGSARSLTSAYGVEYRYTDFLTYHATFDFGQIKDETNGDFDRRALSFGLRYADDALTARGRIEFRNERATCVSPRADLDAFYLTADLAYKIDEDSRILATFDQADSKSDGNSLIDGHMVDLSLGYAFRPVANERLNVLARYRYLNDSFGQEIDGQPGNGAVQKSHVFSLEGNYDLDKQWTLGGKIGGRFSQSAPHKGEAYSSNDAWLAVANMRYHFVHQWDALFELRHLNAVAAKQSDQGALIAVYRHFGDNAQLGLGYNFGSFSGDLTDLRLDDKGIFINLTAKF